MATTTMQAKAAETNGRRFNMPMVITETRPPKPKYVPEWEFITPTGAAEMLERNHPKNRNKGRRWVGWLADLFTNGDYLPTHQGIAFDVDGYLVDGQNRLAAVVESGVGVWMLVTRGMPKGSIMAIDRGMKRTESSQIKMLDVGITPGTVEVGIARVMNSGAGSHLRLDGPPLVAFLSRHWEAIRFAMAHSSRRRTSSCAVRAVVAMAYYHASRERLAEFLRVLDTGEALGEADFAAIRLREKLDRDQSLIGGGTCRAAVYRCTISALSAFLERRPITKIYESPNDPWPLPETAESA